MSATHSMGFTPLYPLTKWILGINSCACLLFLLRLFRFENAEVLGGFFTHLGLAGCHGDE